jgi:tetratricopeptide (TPR) repeat protein
MAPGKQAAATALRPKVFVSYSRRDRDFAAELVAHLETRDFQPFLDRTDIAPGEPWQDRLAGLIRAADTMVFVVSPDSTRSTICEWEIAEAARLGKRILPLVCRPTEDAAIPPTLARLNFIFATEAPDVPRALARLEDSLRMNLDWVREHTRLTEVAFRWDTGGRKRSQVLRGVDLDAAERWLVQLPGDASQPTTLHRELVQVSRHAQRMRQRAWVGGSTAIALAAIVLASFAELSRRRADDALQAARATANTLVTDLATELRDKIGMPVTLVRSILKPALALQERLISSAGVGTGVRTDQSHALALMTNTLLRIGDTQEALKTAARSREIAEEVLRPSPNDLARRSQLCESLRAVAFAEDKAGDLPAARAAMTRRVSLAREDIATNPTEETTLTLLDALTMLGQADLRLDDAPAQATAIEEAFQVARAASTSATTPRFQRALISVLVQLSVVKIRAGDSRGGQDALGEAYDLAAKNAADDTDAAARRDLAQTLMAMAVSFRSLGNAAAEFASVDQSLRIRRELAADKDDYEAGLALAQTLFAAASLRSFGGHADDGIRDFKESIAIFRALARDGSHPRVRIELANALCVLGMTSGGSPARIGDAIAELAESVEIYRADSSSLDNDSEHLWKAAEAQLAKLRAIQMQ